MYNWCAKILIACWVFFLLVLLQACRQHSATQTAFYYWKSTFALSPAQRSLLNTIPARHLYIRFFDIAWSAAHRSAYPNAIINFHDQATGLAVTPVVYITNQVFENIEPGQIDSLAINCNRLVHNLALQQHITTTAIQIDCDWTLTTQQKYFRFLKLLKAHSQLPLQATIRLHQVKYKARTGIPPVDTGILMFYNMSTLSTDPEQPNSIYNEQSAQKYVAFVGQYPLPLQVALPLFSWAIHIRNNRIIQIYQKIGKKELQNQQHFNRQNAVYTAKQSFFMSGIYVKENDIFKLENITPENLQQAARQLSVHLPMLKNRTIIYYELANLDTSLFTAEKLSQVSASF